MVVVALLRMVTPLFEPVETAPGWSQPNREVARRTEVDEADVGKLREGMPLELTVGAIDDQRFDVVLSDVRMPDLDGMSFYHHLEKRSPSTLGGLAFVTGDGLNARVKRFLRYAGKPYLEKPIRADDVKALVNRIGATGAGVQGVARVA